MKKTWIIVIAVVAVLVIYCVSSYNSLVTQEETVGTAWSNVENQYQRRSDLIPNLVNTVKGYAAHEKEVFTNIADARSKLSGAMNNNDVKAIQKSNNELTGALSRLLLIVERYPELKADKQFINLQDELAGTENRLSVARKDYNESVQTINATTRTFPTSIVAAMSGIKAREYFEIDEAEKKAPEVKF